jgi:DNA-directed RNA polymerase subunit omega
MNANLLSAALLVIPNPQMLVNVVRLRLKQLSLGHRPLVTVAPGLGLADVALSEISQGKLTFVSTLGEEPIVALDETKVVEFPAVQPRKKRAA